MRAAGMSDGLANRAKGPVPAAGTGKTAAGPQASARASPAPVLVRHWHLGHAKGIFAVGHKGQVAARSRWAGPGGPVPVGRSRWAGTGGMVRWLTGHTVASSGETAVRGRMRWLPSQQLSGAVCRGFTLQLAGAGMPPFRAGPRWVAGAAVCGHCRRRAMIKPAKSCPLVMPDRATDMRRVSGG